MSKRASRRRRKQKEQTKRSQMSGVELAREAVSAVKQGDYNGAIQCLEQAKHKQDTPKSWPTALAEAYFQRALQNGHDISDLQSAVKLQSNEARYQYHLALAYHKAGEFDKAEPIYRNITQSSSPIAERAATSLMQLLMQKGQVISKEPALEQLPARAAAELAVVEGLVTNKAKSTLDKLLAADDISPLLRGVAALKLGEEDTAAHHLAAIETDESGVAAYCLGLLAARHDKHETALRYWNAAAESGLTDRVVNKNRAIGNYRQAFDYRQAGKYLKAAQSLERISQSHRIPQLKETQQQLMWEAAYQAAQRGLWQQAMTYWEKLLKQGDDSRSLVFNLALAYQNNEYYLQAAERWREVLRRRPRKKEHPEALNDQQVARIWQATAENYSKAGDYEEAIKTYKNAIKWSPDNLDLRLQMVEVYQSEGRWQAAVNELDRILEKDADNVRALLMQADNYADDFLKESQALDYLKRAIKLEPQNPIAQQQIIQLYRQMTIQRLNWMVRPMEIIMLLWQGLTLLPDHPRLLHMLGFVFNHFGDTQEAHIYYNKALDAAGDDINLIYSIYNAWLVTGTKEDIAAMFERIIALPKSTMPDLFVDLIHLSFEHGETYWGERLLDWFEVQYADTPDALFDAAFIHYMQFDNNQQAIKLLKQILDIDENHIRANIFLGKCYYELNQTNLTKQYWNKAKLLAEEANDDTALNQISYLEKICIYNEKNPSSMSQGVINPESLAQFVDTTSPEIQQLVEKIGLEGLAELVNEMEEDSF